MNDTLEYRLAQAEKKITALETELRDFEKTAAELERKRLTWGISALGAVVMTLGAIIWQYRTVIFK